MDTTTNKYNAALETAKKWIADGCSEKERICLESVFPELRESKDEIHEKWILEYLYDGLHKADEQFKDHFKAAIAWLEKKEESNVDKLHRISTPAEENWFEIQKQWEQEDSADKDEGVREELIQYLRDYPHLPNGKYTRLDFFAYLEKQKAQKSAEWSGFDKACHNVIHDAIRGKFVSASALHQAMDWFDSLPERLTLTPKQEWTEEDEHRLKDCIYFLESAMKHYADTSEIVKTIDWLNARRPANQEWNEEDEEQYHFVLDGLRYAHADMDRVGSLERAKHVAWAYEWFKNRVKSLRPQPQWKPSEEQMEALKNTAYGIYQNSDGPALRELYNDLKKL